MFGSRSYNYICFCYCPCAFYKWISFCCCCCCYCCEFTDNWLQCMPIGFVRYWLKYQHHHWTLGCGLWTWLGWTGCVITCQCCTFSSVTRTRRVLNANKLYYVLLFFIYTRKKSFQEQSAVATNSRWMDGVVGSCKLQQFIWETKHTKNTAIISQLLLVVAVVTTMTASTAIVVWCTVG